MNSVTHFLHARIQQVKETIIVKNHMEKLVPIKPISDRVIVARLKAAEKTEGGLYLPGVAQDKPLEGTVIATGPGATTMDGVLHPVTVQPGDKILFGKKSGVEIEVEGKTFLLMREDEIYGVFQ